MNLELWEWKYITRIKFTNLLNEFVAKLLLEPDAYNQPVLRFL